MQFIENKTFDEIEVGASAELTQTLRQQDIELFAVMSEDVNSAHVDREYAKTDMFHEVIAHGMWGGALISAMQGTELPGPGTIYLNQSLSFCSAVGLGDPVTFQVTVHEKNPENHRLILDCLCLNQDGETEITGEAEVMALHEKVRRPETIRPDVHQHERGARHRKLIERTREIAPIRTVAVDPCDGASLSGALQAGAKGLIEPVLVGPRARIEAVNDATGVSLDGVEIIDVAHCHAAASRAVELVGQGGADAPMKGALHSDELMRAALEANAGLRTERRASQLFALDVSHYPKPPFITDAAINIAPDLSCKSDIIQNAIEPARALGIEMLNIAILSAVETVNPKIPSTLDAAALCKMAGRGQIIGGVLDGPLAFDNAISPETARIKGIASPVAVDADILLVPDLETGNMLAKKLQYRAGADAAGLVLGLRAPIILTSRADGRVIVAHLGNTASICAMNNHQSVATSMGFTTLDGLMMGRWCGSLDAGVVLHLVQEKGLSVDEVKHMLYPESGLLGVSGFSNNMHVLEESSDARADEEIALFCYRAVREIDALAATLGGLDALVFTAGIGENPARVRRQICAPWAWLGIALDDAANEAGPGRISAAGSTIDVRVINTNEEAMIAASKRNILKSGQASEIIE